MRDIASAILRDIITAPGGSTAPAEGRMASNSDRRSSAKVHAGGERTRAAGDQDKTTQLYDITHRPMILKAKVKAKVKAIAEPGRSMSREVRGAGVTGMLHRTD